MTVSSLVRPAFFAAPDYARTLGPEVADLCDLAGFSPDPEQRFLLDAIFALRPDNKVAARAAAVIAGRQNIKTGLFKQAALGWLYVTDQRLVVWSAHEFSTAQEAHRDLSELVTNSDVLRRRVKAIHNGNGDEAIELVTGQRVKFKARTKTGGRGLTGDKIVLDEAFALTAAHMGSLLPTLSARPDPQVLYGSSAGLLMSAVLRDIRNRGRKKDPGLIYAEWCDDLGGECGDRECDHSRWRSGCRLDDVRRWYRTNSQLRGPDRPDGRILLETIEDERKQLPPMEFARERCGWWEDPPNVEGGALDAVKWGLLAAPNAPMGRAPLFGVDIDEARMASLSVVWQDGPLARGEMACPPVPAHRLVETAKDLTERHGGRVAVPSVLVDDMKKASVPHVEVKSTDWPTACAALVDAMNAGTFRHGNQPDLNDAARAVRWGPTTTQNVKAFQLRDSPGAGPLFALVRALYALNTGAPSVYEERGLLSL